MNILPKLVGIVFLHDQGSSFQVPSSACSFCPYSWLLFLTAMSSIFYVQNDSLGEQLNNPDRRNRVALSRRQCRYVFRIFSVRLV